MSEQGTTKELVCEHDFVCLECGASLDDLHQPIGWMTEGGEAFIEHRLKLERPEDFVRFTIPVPRVPVAANEEPTDPVPSKERCKDCGRAKWQHSPIEDFPCGLPSTPRTDRAEKCVEDDGVELVVVLSDVARQLERELAETRETLVKREKFIEGEWFNRVTYKQQLRAALEKIERLELTLHGVSTCSTCEACRGAAMLALGERTTVDERELAKACRCNHADPAKCIGVPWGERCECACHSTPPPGDGQG